MHTYNYNLSWSEVALVPGLPYVRVLIARGWANRSLEPRLGQRHISTPDLRLFEMLDCPNFTASTEAKLCIYNYTCCLEQNRSLQPHVLVSK